MKIAVMGAGAVGCYYGGMLARAGHDVVLIGRPAHVEVFETSGLHLQTTTFDETVRVSASVSPDAIDGADAVLFCVKSTDTDQAAQEIAPYLRPDTLVVSLQNGVENADRLRELLSQPIAASVVYVGAGMAGPGHVIHYGRGELVIEPANGSAALAEAFVAAGVPTEVSADVRSALWTKLVINCAYNALSAITQLPYGPLFRSDGIPESINAIVAECRAVAAAEGVALAGNLDAAVAQIADSMAGQRSSTAQDLARGKRSEIDHLNGVIVRRGDANGIPVPMNRVLHALVKLLEAKA